ncbi:MAG: UvrD-helicase domain-containing protein [Lachnospiraceae bacterium]|nr:UvrD-helicase domain-containing protein [Lachnospiraceae bacterium]
MSVKWTEEQQQVIDARNQDILVSAAAGSGKTAVLVERILKMITDEEKPVDIDRLLVVTFTNAAASEMRGRIRDALEERAEKDPDNVHLQKQLVLVHNAKITTIHSFCLHVLRNHFQTIGIDPSFRIADEGEVLLLEQDAVKEVVNEAYETLASGNAAENFSGEEFAEFLEQFVTGKDDALIEDWILQLYHTALGQPFPEDWLRQCREAYADAAWPKAETSASASAPRKKDSERSSGDTSESRPSWLNYIEKDTSLRLEDVHETLRTALRLARDPDGPYPYEKALLSDLALVERLEKGKTYEGFLKAFQEMGSFEALGRKKDDHISEEKKQLVKSLRDECKDQISALREQYYYDDLDVLREEYFRSGIVVRVLTRLTEAFMKRLSEKKAQKNILDFGDMEHMALNALVTREKKASGSCSASLEGGIPYGSGKVYPTAVAQEYAETFEEVMIDEYQDSNLVQEMILTSVSGRGRGAHNRFMVGDVKQSIYRFRLARPELFMEKYHHYQVLRGAGSQSAPVTERRIDLHRNFRSRTQVLESVNFVFRQIMQESLGGVAYDADAALYPGAAFAEPAESYTSEAANAEPAESYTSGAANAELAGSHASEKANAEPAGNSASGGAFSHSDTAHNWYTSELLLLDVQDASTEELRKEEARMVGRRIQELVGTMPILDKESSGFRPARYGDIVILLRTISGWGETFGEVLSDMGIPCFTGSQKGYFSAAEVRVILSYLKILDNPQQDIPLAAVLRSPIGRFSDEELSRIRLLGGGEATLSFYDCCLRLAGISAASEEEKLLQKKMEGFLSVYQSLREKCDHTPIHLLLWEILDVTGYGEYAAALPAGRQRKANLDMLVEKAIAYEATSYHGLYHFVRYIENLQKYEVDYGEASLGAEAGDTVRIMSIHKSKGLEFPIVFVSGMGKQFNESDTRGKVVMHPEWGIACDCVWQGDAVSRGNETYQQDAAFRGNETHQQDLALRGNETYQGDAALHENETQQENTTPRRESMSHIENEAPADIPSEVSDAMPRMRRATLLKKTIQQKISSENLGEELRVLYVAMTRAKEKLILTGGVKNLEKKQMAWQNAAPSYSSLAGASNYLDWVAPALMRQSDEYEAVHFVVSIQTPQENVQKEAAAQEEGWRTLQELLCAKAPEDVAEETRSYLEDVFSSSYPYAGEHAISGKYSVSELKKMSQRTQENDARELYEEETVVPLIPRFAQQSLPKSDDADLHSSVSNISDRKSALSGAARGTAFHTFMENLDFSKKEDLRFQLEELISCGKMTEEEAASVNLGEISVFLRSSVGRRMERASAAGELFREQPFVLGVPAGEILKNGSSEMVLVQGIIDAWFLEDGQIVLVDYKTDRVSSKRKLIERYRTQIDYYAKALERLTGKKLRDRVIYSFCLGEEIFLSAR